MSYGSALLAAVVAVGLLAAGGAAAPPDDGRLTVTDVAVSPGTPTVDDTVRFEVTLRNSAGSPSAVDVRTVRLVTADGERLAAANDTGTLSQGDTLTIPLAATFDRAGPKDLVVVAEGVDADGNRTVVRRPVSLVVERAPPQLSVDAEAAVAGAPTNVSVGVANPRTVAVRNLTVSVAGENVTAVDGRERVPTLAAGGSATVSLVVRPREAGETTLRLRVTYTTASGRTATTNLTRTVSVAAAERDVGVRVEPATDDGGGQAPDGVPSVIGGQTLQSDGSESGSGDRPDAVSVTVTNFGNAVATDVVLVPTGTDSLGRQSVASSLAPGESASVTVDLSQVDSDTTVEFRAEYRMAGQADTTSTTYEVRPATGAVELTGLNLTLGEDGKLQLSGNVGNVGDREVTGVVVEVGSNRHADPAYPRRSYFVGTIGGSEFAPFELTATVDADNVTAVPIRVRYTVAGTERSNVVRVPFSDDLRPSGGGGTLPSWLLVGGVGLVAALPVGWLVVRRYGDR